MTAGWVPEPRPDLGRLRAGHADRERAIDVLKAAFAEGRLDQDEYTERVGQAHAARTYGELATLTSDLPVGPLGSLTPAGVPVPMAPMLPATGPGAEHEPPAIQAADRRSGGGGIAFVALLCGIIAFSIPWGFLMAVPAIIGGWVALAAPGRCGRWTAIAAIALGAVTFLKGVHGG
jgi:DUF1707 SHOCT-like domain